MALVLAPASLRWRVVAASSNTGLSDDPIRADVVGHAPDRPIPAVRPAASLCRILKKPPSHVWWCTLPKDRVFVIYWTSPPTVQLAALNGSALQVARDMPDIECDARNDREILLNVINSLTTGLIYHDDGGCHIIANRAGRRILGLGNGKATMRAATMALTRFCGRERGAQPGLGMDVERDGRVYQVRSEAIQFAFGSGVLWRIEDVTEEAHRRTRLAEVKRVALMGEVAGEVGHQFNNLLARLICQAEAVQDATSTGEASELAERIIETSEAGAVVVRRLMTYAEVSVISCETVDLRPLIQSWTQRREGTLAIEADTCVGLVIADTDLLHACLDELCANAMRAGATSLRLRGLERSPETLDLEVADDGQGMEPDDCARAPDPFFTRSAVGEGIGLGLSMVKGAMRQCGGGIAIASTPGQGTIVTLSLLRAPGGVRA